MRSAPEEWHLGEAGGARAAAQAAGGHRPSPGRRLKSCTALTGSPHPHPHPHIQPKAVTGDQEPHQRLALYFLIWAVEPGAPPGPCLDTSLAAH